MIRINHHEMTSVFKAILMKKGLVEELAQRSAELFTMNSLDGVYSHGVNRFPRVAAYIDKGYIKPNEKPTIEVSFGGLERLNGNLGMGNTNAEMAMNRAIELAKSSSIGLVALGNTNHWMRGGTYGWQAADAGMIGMCWTNTMPNMPAWGTKTANIGNNPFVLAIPRSNGEHVVVDCAMSQFSYGKLEEYRLQGKELPIAGGYDITGQITTNPSDIEKSGRVLPIGFWKGSGLSIAFDLIATVLSGGLSTTGIGKNSKDEYGVSQIFIAIDPKKVSPSDNGDLIIEETLQAIKTSDKAENTEHISYPGERVIKTREDNLKYGIPVREELWQEILRL